MQKIEVNVFLMISGFNLSGNMGNYYLSIAYNFSAGKIQCY